MSDQPHVNIFYTDENVDGPAIGIARNKNQAVQIVTAAEAGMLGAEDDEHFLYAIEHGYVLVTGNIRHFAPLVREYIESGREYPGIIFIRADHQKNSILIADALINHLHDILANQVRWA